MFKENQRAHSDPLTGCSVRELAQEGRFAGGLQEGEWSGGVYVLEKGVSLSLCK